MVGFCCLAFFSVHYGFFSKWDKFPSLIIKLNLAFSPNSEAPSFLIWTIPSSVLFTYKMEKLILTWVDQNFICVWSPLKASFATELEQASWSPVSAIVKVSWRGDKSPTGLKTSNGFSGFGKSRSVFVGSSLPFLHKERVPNKDDVEQLPLTPLRGDTSTLVGFWSFFCLCWWGALPYTITLK